MRRIGGKGTKGGKGGVETEGLPEHLEVIPRAKKFPSIVTDIERFGSIITTSSNIGDLLRYGTLEVKGQITAVSTYHSEDKSAYLDAEAIAYRMADNLGANVVIRTGEQTTWNGNRPVVTLEGIACRYTLKDAAGLR